MKPLAVEITGQGDPFRFSLSWKLEIFGNTSVRHLWIDKRSLYKPGPGRGDNYSAVVDLFWELHRRESETQIGNYRGEEETYLLARLVPHTRMDGSKRIMPDSILGSPSGPRTAFIMREAANELNSMLVSDRDSVRSREQFHLNTRNMLMPPLADVPPPSYRTFTDELLKPAREFLRTDCEKAVNCMLSQWNPAMKRWGRRGGFEEKKLVLDILSYECRAAFHRCYGEAWHAILPSLIARFNLSSAEHRFHRLWHLLLANQAENENHNRYLFHGHIFALHPAIGLILQTNEGMKIMESYILASEAVAQETPFQRFLFAAEVALHLYVGRRNDDSERRKSLRQRPMDGIQLDVIEQDKIDRRRSNRQS